MTKRSDYFQNDRISYLIVSFLLFTLHISGQSLSLTTLFAPNDTTVVLQFNRPIIVQGTGAFSIGYFSGNDKYPKRLALSSDEKELRLTFARTFPENRMITLIWFGIKDKATSTLLAQTSATFTYSTPTPPTTSSFGSIIFTEILFDPPTTSSTLPNAEYIEIRNRTEAKIILRGWQIVRANTPLPIPDVTLESGEYALLINASKSSLFPSGKIIPISTLFALRNEGDTLSIRDSNQQLIAALCYQKSWLGSIENAAAHRSIEVIDESNLSSLSDNWSGSMDPRGGTPAQRNSINGQHPDHRQPQITEINYPSAHEVQVRFSRPMLPNPLIDKNNYRFDDSSLKIEALDADYPMGYYITLHLNKALTTKWQTRLRMTHLMDFNQIPLNESTSYIIELPSPAEEGDLRISEILNNPSQPNGDYVEIYNTASYAIDQADLYLHSTPVSGKTPERAAICSRHRPLAAQHHLLICQDSAQIKSLFFPPDSIQVTLPEKMPTLYNDHGDIILTNGRKELLDSLSFNKSLHSPLLKEQKGVALERNSFLEETNQSTNWHSGSAATHFGTPGYPNTTIIKNPSPFALLQQNFSPNNDGIDDLLLLQYQLSEEATVSVNIYNRNGTPIRQVIRQQLLVGLGSIEWDGKDDRGSLCPIGPYILVVEWQFSNSKAYQTKEAIVLSRL